VILSFIFYNVDQTVYHFDLRLLKKLIFLAKNQTFIIMSKKTLFTGQFGEYFIMFLGLMILSWITLGLALPYWFYWSFKYFFTKMEIQE